LFEARLNKRIKVTIQYRLCIGRFNIRPEILDPGRIKNIGSNLAAPANIRLVVLDYLLFDPACLILHLIQLGLQLLNGLILILVLRSLVLTLHHDSGRNVGQANCRFCFIHMLAASTAGTIGIDPHL
jgi:hypothetical protein